MLGISVLLSSHSEKVSKVVDLIKAKGGKVTREPGPVTGGNTVMAFVEDPDGYKFELSKRGPAPEPLYQVMLRVGDLDRSINFYEKAFGMELLRKRDNSEYKLKRIFLMHCCGHQFLHLQLFFRMLEKICKDPQMLADIFDNYDCDFEAPNLFERMVHAQSKIAQGTINADRNSVTSQTASIKGSSLQ